MSFLQRLFGGGRAQAKRTQLVLDAVDSEVDQDALAAMPLDEQRKTIVAVLQELEKRERVETDSAKKNRMRNTARRLNQKLELLEKLERAKSAAKRLPEGGLKYICRMNDGDDPRDMDASDIGDIRFEFKCLPYDLENVDLDQLAAIEADDDSGAQSRDLPVTPNGTDVAAQEHFLTWGGNVDEYFGN